MLEELKNLKPFNAADLFYFYMDVLGSQTISIKDLHTLYQHVPSNQYCDVCSLIKFCKVFDFIYPEQNKIKLKPEIVERLNNLKRLSVYLNKAVVNKLFTQGIFKETFFSYDHVKHRYKFKNEQLPLSLANVRNLLVNLGFFELDRQPNITKFFINTTYEPFLAEHCKRKKRLFSLEQLQATLEKDCEVGEFAEAFVYEFEKKRISNPALGNKIKVISDIDVCAGYDILSFSSSSSRNYDRFIEVKALSSKGFFWSRNEIEVAKLRSIEYFLYLVDLTQVEDPLYVPEMIQNPFEEIFTSIDWLVEAQSFHIRNVSGSKLLRI